MCQAVQHPFGIGYQLLSRILRVKKDFTPWGQKGEITYSNKRRGQICST